MKTFVQFGSFAALSRFLFLGENEGVVNSCKDACDSDDSGSDDFTDDINILKVLFSGGVLFPLPVRCQTRRIPAARIRRPTVPRSSAATPTSPQSPVRNRGRYLEKRAADLHGW